MIWGKMMRRYAGETAGFTPPQSIISLKICKQTTFAGPYCPAEDIYTEYFIKNQTLSGYPHGHAPRF